MKEKTKEQMLIELEELHKKNNKEKEELKAANQQLQATEQQLRASNEKLLAQTRELSRMATVVKDSNDAITVQDLEGNITAWNAGATKIYGYSEQEALKMNISSLVPDEYKTEALNFISSLKKGELVESLETKRLSKDGKILDIWLVITKLLDNDGKLLGTATTERDITERKQAEEKLKAYNQQLQASEQQLKAANQQLDASNQQLTANELTLRAANQKLQATELQLRAANQQLVASELTIRESKDRLSNFMNSATEGFTIWDSEMNLIEMNHSQFKLFPAGTKKEDIIGKNALKLVPGIKESGRHEEYLNVIKTGKPYSVEDLVIHPIFGNRILNVKAFKVGDGLGLITTDITERKQAEEKLIASNQQLKASEQQLRAANQQLQATELQLRATNQHLVAGEQTIRESEEKYRNVVENTEDLITVVDGNGNLTFTNPVCHKIWGKSAEEMIGKSAFEMIHPDDREFTRQEFGKWISQKSDTITFENRQVNQATGRIFVMQWIIKPQYNEDGSIAKITSLARDITEQKQAEEKLKAYNQQLLASEMQLKAANQQLQAIEQQLRATNQQLVASEQAIREREQKFRETIQSLDEGYYSVTLDGILLEHNRAFNLILGFDETEDLKGSRLPDFWQNPDDRNDYIKELITNGSISKYLVNAKKRTGEKIFVLASSHIVKDEKNKPLRIEGVFIDYTERKQLDEEYQTIISTALDGFWILDIEGNILDVNEAYCRMSGYSREELLSMHITDLEAKESIEENKKHIQKTIDEGYDRFESSHLCKDGSIIEVEINATYSSFGNERFYVFIHDITERKQTEEKLKASNQQLQASEQQLKATNQQLMASEQVIRENEERYALVIDASEQGIWDWNVETNRVYYSPQWKKQIGYEDYELANDFATWVEHLHPDEKDNCQKAVEDYLINPEKHFMIEFRFRHKDGSYRWIYNKAASIRNSDGQIVRMFGAHTDITEKKTAEELLIESEKKFRNTIETLPVAIYLTTGVEQVLEYMNPYMIKLFGYTPEDIPSVAHWWPLAYPDLDYRRQIAEEWNQKVERAIANQTPIESMDVVVTCKDGSHKNIVWDFVTMGDKNYAFGIDLTEIKQAQKALRQSEEKFSVMFQKAPFSAALTGMSDLRLIEVNEKFEKLWGYSSEEAIGKSSLELNLYPDEAERNRLSAIFQEQGFIHDVESRMQSKSGELREVLFNSDIVEINSERFILTSVQDITERKQAKEELQKSEILNKTLIAHLPQRIFLKDLNSVYMNCNQNYANDLGTTPHEIIGKNDFDFYPEELANAYRTDDREVIKQGTIKNIEEKFIQKGKELWVKTIKVPYRDRENNIIGVLGVFEDITERKKAEEELWLQAQIIDNSPIIVAYHDKDLNMVWANKAYQKATGLNLEKIKGRKCYDVWGLTQPCRGCPVILAIETGENKSAELTPNNQDHWPETQGSWISHAAPLRGKQGNIIGAIEFAIDITERKLAEEKLRNLSEMQSIILRMASAYINMPQELFEDSINNSLKEIGEFVQADRAYIFDYDWTSNVCNNTYEWCNEGINPEIDNLQNVPNEMIDFWVEAHINGREMNIVDVMQLPQDDGVRQILEQQGVKSVMAVPMMKLDKCIGFIGFDSVRIIHKYSEKERTLLKIFSEMLVNVGNRIELEKNLVQTKEKAEESNRLKTAFLNNMSHEIRTPLNGITGFIGLLQDSAVDDEQKQLYFDIINKSSDRLIATVTDIIDISKIEAGQVKVLKTEVSVNDILEEQYRFFYHQAQTKGLELFYKPSLSETEARFVTDKHKLEGILTNLIKNAIKFTDQGEITFACSLKKEQDIEILEFYVKDTGIGIPANRIEAIFNRFEQADIEDTKVFEGSGLGLAISKSYVEMLGGEITVCSEVGLGSTFTFSIPYTKQLVKGSNDKDIITKEPKTALSNLSVIIAEDDETSKMYFEAIFKNGYKNITYTKTGKETIDKCRENPETDLILMDIKMPGMNGYDATHEIRKFNSDVIIIAQTAFGLTGDREKAIEAGCNDYIAKPIKKEELEIIIKKHFKNYKKLITN